MCGIANNNGDLPLISVVIPCRNSLDTIDNCMDSLMRLDYQNYEIIFVDGMSTDGTRRIKLFECGKMRMVDNPKYVVVSARNIGFEAAQGELIAFSDSDCTFDKNWLLNSVKYFSDPHVACVGGANLIPDTETSFAKAVGKIFAAAWWVGAGAPTGVLHKAIETRSHGSNVIYRKSALAKVMPMDETILEGEDVVMNQKLEALGYKLLYVPDVRVYHHRRSTPRSFYNQMKRYGQAKRLIQKRGYNISITQSLICYFGVLGTFPGAILALLLYRSKNVGIAAGTMLFAYSWGYWGEVIKGQQ